MTTLISSLVFGTEGKYDFFGIPVTFENPYKIEDRTALEKIQAIVSRHILHPHINWETLGLPTDENDIYLKLEKVIDILSRQYQHTFMHELGHSLTMKYAYDEYGSVRMWTTGGGLTETTKPIWNNNEDHSPNFPQAFTYLGGPLLDVWFCLFETFTFQCLRSVMLRRFSRHKKIKLITEIVYKFLQIPIASRLSKTCLDWSFYIFFPDNLEYSHDLFNLEKSAGKQITLAAIAFLAIPVFINFSLMLKSKEVNTHLLLPENDPHSELPQSRELFPKLFFSYPQNKIITFIAKKILFAQTSMNDALPELNFRSVVIRSYHLISSLLISVVKVIENLGILGRKHKEEDKEV